MNNNRLYYSNQRGKYGTTRFNCWGATAFILGIEYRLRWLQEFEMNEILKENTVIISDDKKQRGDILTIYNSWSLEHTAIYLGRGKYFHKKGGNNSEITDINGVYAIYGKHRVEYRRVVKSTT